MNNKDAITTDEVVEKSKKQQKKNLIILFSVGTTIIVAAVLIFTFVCFHDWQEATCVAPTTCSKCGKTKGEALSHEWLEATYTVPKTCKICGLTEGEPLPLIGKVKDAYDESLNIANKKNKNQDYSYLLLHNELLSLVSDLNENKYDKDIIISLFGQELSKSDAIKHTTQVLSYVVSENGDYLSALMRTFSNIDSVSGTIETTKVDIVVNDVADLLSELKLSPETFGRILAMLEIYDYSWIDTNAEKLLVFTEKGFSFNWKSVSDYVLDLQYQARPLSKNDFIISILDTNETIDAISYLNTNYPQGGCLSLYDDKNYAGSSAEGTYDQVYTERGVTVESSLDLVFSTYGQADIELADTKSSLYKYVVSDFDDYRKNLFLFQCKSYCKYTYENDCCIYFCFDANKNVSWIIYSTVKNTY